MIYDLGEFFSGVITPFYIVIRPDQGSDGLEFA
jgi:hypothetical protein